MSSSDAVSNAMSALWATMTDASRRCDEYGLASNVVAEGRRYATDLARWALTLHLHNNDVRRPQFTEMITPTLRWGWDNPYTTYHYAPISGGHTYRLFGQRNSSIYLGLTVYGGGDERHGTMPTSVVGSLNDTSFPPGSTWDVILSPDAPPPGTRTPWLRLDADASSVVIRQYFDRPNDQTAATMHIETVPATTPAEAAPPTLSDAALVDSINAARRYFSEMWAMSDAVVSTHRARTMNQFFAPVAGGFDAEGRPSGYMYPTKDNLYTFGWYELDDDQMLVVDVTPPPCRYWSFYLGSVFQQSLPYGPDFGLITHDNAVMNSDGSVRFVVAANDPQQPNWLPTQGHRVGMMATRWLLATVDAPPIPRCTVVDAPH